MYLPETTTYSEFRENLSSHFKRLKKSDKPTLITQNGKTAAVVMSPSAYERLMSDAEESRSIERLKQAQKSTKGRPPSNAFADLHAMVDAIARKQGPARKSKKTR